MQTSHPHSQFFSESILNDCITFARIFATESTQDYFQSILPIIPTREEWNEYWDFEWNSAMDYVSEGLCTSQLYPPQLILPT